MFCGIDDTDSKFGMCTTYIAAKMIRDLKLKLIGFPKLIRLNPNIPFKTRGNGAVSFEFTDAGMIEEITQYVFEKSHFGKEGTNPGVVFLNEKKEIIISSIRKRSKRKI